jgi:hypothetical protein
MTIRKQTLLLAELCGTHLVCITEDGYEIKDKAGKKCIITEYPGGAVGLSYDPEFIFWEEYTEDLNAMREAVMTLDSKQLEQFHDRLTAGVIGWSSYEKPWVVYRATAAQWAEAFLLTKGLWED